MRHCSSIIIILIFFNFSCKSILQTVAGIHNPRTITDTQFKNFLLKYDLKDDNILVPKNLQFDTIYSYINYEMPKLIIFNKDGFILNVKDSSYCNATAGNFLKNLNPRSIEVLPKGKLKIEEFTNRLFAYPAFAKPNPEFKLDGSDLYVFVFFTEWVGQLNKTYTAKWEKEVLNKKEIKIKYYKVNMDYHK